MEDVLQQMVGMMKMQQEAQVQAQQHHEQEMKAWRKALEKRVTPVMSEKVRMTPYKDDEDIEDFLERTMEPYDRTQDQWVKELVPLLQGKARAACATVDYSRGYDHVKEMILRRFLITPEESRRRFREMKWSSEMDPEDYVTRMTQLAKCWLRLDDRHLQMQDKIIVEHLINRLQHGIRIWMSDHQPRNAAEVSELMQTYQSSRSNSERGDDITRQKGKPVFESNKTFQKKEGIHVDKKEAKCFKCFKCGHKGHFKYECPNPERTLRMEEEYPKLHGVTKSRIERIASAYKCQVSAPIDSRGRHKNRPHAITDTILHQIDKHICSFPARESHYFRNDNHHKVYLSPDLSIAKMHEMYLEVHEQSVFDEISAGGTSKPMVTYETYRTHFNMHHNISFGRPRS